MSAHDPIASSESRNAIAERAATFFGRRRGGDWGANDQAELDAWLAESTFHRVAYLRVAGIAARADQLVTIGALGSKQNKSISARIMRHRRLIFPLLAAASVVLFAALGVSFVKFLEQPADRTDSTDVGGRTLLTFSDHTQIELSTNTAIRFRMTTAERIVWLEKGEAWFHVSHDAAHPFTVIVGKHRITDLGTEFLVRRNTDTVNVTLLNGRATLSAEGIQTATLSPGEEAIVTPFSLSVTRKTPQALADELAWRRGMLVFHNTPLTEVVREFNRYNTTKLAIADPSIADKTISAALRTDDYESFLQMAEDTLKLHVDREGSIILISRGQRGATHRAGHLKHSL